jgi:hypothetical protein
MTFNVSGHTNTKTTAEVRAAARKFAAEVEATNAGISDADGYLDLIPSDTPSAAATVNTAIDPGSGT